METFETDGIVLKSEKFSEADRLVTFLTREKGLVRAFANGALRPKSKLHAGVGNFCYGHFSFARAKENTHVKEAVPSEIFYKLRDNLEKLTAAQYFCELAEEAAPENENAEDLLRLLLNTLHFLSGGLRLVTVLKPICEFRTLSLSGYMPNLVGCDACGAFESPAMRFDAVTGLLYCDKCRTPNRTEELPLAAVTAMRHIIYSELKPMFDLNIDAETAAVLNAVSEKYLLNMTKRRFGTLDFYRTLKYR
ncbi:MAG: DNA repair protein RecO [Oscillospiraceae bacterium]|nr:DNA repair protein RecO [Oscillospiraceae bacterium]